MKTFLHHQDTKTPRGKNRGSVFAALFLTWCLGALVVNSGCAHAEPLPANAPMTLHWTPVTNATSYGIYYLTNTAPDFALGTNSVNFTHYLPDRNDTNAVISAVPAASLLVVVSRGTNNAVSGYSVPVTVPASAPAPVTFSGVFFTQ